MNPVVGEWIAKADGDHASAMRDLRARKNPNYDAACFHAQQCVEKYVKGIMQARGIRFGRIHDLALLLDECLDEYPLWESFRPDFKMLTQYAVVFRYPGEFATKADARQAVQAATRLRQEFRATPRRAGYPPANSG